jgi:hypothetical protein
VHGSPRARPLVEDGGVDSAGTEGWHDPCTISSPAGNQQDAATETDKQDPEGGFQTMKKLLSILCLSILLMPLAACSVEQTEEGELPNVDVNATEGEMPEYDVDAADVEVGTETKEIEVPDVDIEPPAEDEAEDMTEGENEPPAN